MALNTPRPCDDVKAVGSLMVQLLQTPWSAEAASFLSCVASVKARELYNVRSFPPLSPPSNKKASILTRILAQVFQIEITAGRACSTCSCSFDVFFPVLELGGTGIDFPHPHNRVAINPTSRTSFFFPWELRFVLS